MAKERRLLPRYRVVMPAEFLDEGGRWQQLTVCDVSSGGMQLECSRRVADEIFPPGQAMNTFLCSPIRIRVKLPPADQPVVAECKIDFARRMSRDHFLFGVQFRGFEDGGEAAFDAFVSSLASGRKR